MTTTAGGPAPGDGAPRRRRVCHVITRLDLGGAQQNTLYSVRHHDRSTFRVELIAGQGGLLDEDARSIADADVHLVPWLPHPVSPLRDALALRRLTSHFRRARPDVVHTHSSKAGIVAREAARRARVPVVVHTVHGWSFNDWQAAWRRRLYVRLERRAARCSDALVVVAGADRERGLAEGIGLPERYRLIRSGIDVESFRPTEGARQRARAELGFGPGDVVVGTVANMKPQKAPLDFVETAARLVAGLPAARFVFAGDGPLRPAVERAIGSAGLSGRIRLLGWVRDPRPVLHALDVFVLTSRFEGLPRSVLQAMAAGVPVVATAVDGTPEVVRDGETGLLVPPADPERAARAVLRMTTDGGLRERCVANAAGALGGSFEVRVMVRELDDLYRDLLGARDRSSDLPRTEGTARRT